MTKFVAKNEHQYDMCCNEIEFHVYYMLISTGSTRNKMEMVYATDKR